ncbi:uncharacterized protein VTP21DRAFT_5186 [Calcarisporiella thermophila]|uniref:uncharacterized protein n=1 Tax=Calcarisporiella thermophila TaxID=911321 RepID=UPI003742E690
MTVETESVTVSIRSLLHRPTPSATAPPIATEKKENPASGSPMFTDTLYITEPGTNASEAEITELMSACQPTEVKFYEERTHLHGHIRFPSSKQAERAFALFNETVVGTQLHPIYLSITSSSSQKVEAQAKKLLVSQLPLHADNNFLFNLFRPHGPIATCRVLIDNGMFKGSALIHYFVQADAEQAMKEMHGRDISGRNIAVEWYDSQHYATSTTSSPSTPQLVVSSTATSPTQSNGSYRAPPVKLVDQQLYDPTNLYVKNLDMRITSTDLFSLFSRFGRIISARVMTNPITGQSKGFGFVSFSKAEEAARALHAMNGQQTLSKQLIVAYHEPKKSREQKITPATSPTLLAPGGIPIRRFSTSAYNDVQVPPVSNSDGTVNSEFLSALPSLPAPVRNNILRPELEKRLESLCPAGESDRIVGQLMDMSVSDIGDALKSPSALEAKVGDAKRAMGMVRAAPAPSQEHLSVPRTLRRRGSVGSVSSVMTERTASDQKKKMTDAVARITSEYVEDIVDMLLTLRRKERSLCLFNPDYLREKIRMAREALDIVGEEEEPSDSEEEEEIAAAEEEDEEREKERKRVPKAVGPVIAVPLPQHQGQTPLAQAPKKHPEAHVPSSADKLLSTLAGLSEHQQKEIVGERLYPVIKALGVKRANRITIRLLDTEGIHVLVQALDDPTQLRTLVDKAVVSMS